LPCNNQASIDGIIAGGMQGAERRRELGRFLRDRRSRLKPDDVGLPDIGRRRVPGLRREEVSALAGVGVTWYTMLESGTADGASPDMLAAVARALRLDEDETAYLYRLAENREGSAPSETVDRELLGALHAVEWAPAYVLTSRWTVLAWNAAMSLVWGIDPPDSERPFNIVRRMFSDSAMRSMHGERFSSFASGLVAMVRSGASAWLEDAEYRQLCEDLRADPVFSAAWDAYDVATPLGSRETIVTSRLVGEFRYRPVTLEAPGDFGHWLVVQVPDEDSNGRLCQALLATRRNKDLLF